MHTQAELGLFVVFGNIKTLSFTILSKIVFFMGLLYHPSVYYISFWQIITDEGSMLETRILSILLFPSGFNGCPS